MAPLQKEVNGWRLVTAQSGNYEYERRIGNQIFTAWMSKFTGGDKDFWEMGAQGGSDSERFGGASNMEWTFDEARQATYAFLENFEHTGMHSRGYNQVVQASDAAGWEIY